MFTKSNNAIKEMNVYYKWLPFMKGLKYNEPGQEFKVTLKNDEGLTLTLAVLLAVVKLFSGSLSSSELQGSAFV